MANFYHSLAAKIDHRFIIKIIFHHHHYYDWCYHQDEYHCGSLDLALLQCRHLNWSFHSDFKNWFSGRFSSDVGFKKIILSKLVQIAQVASNPLSDPLRSTLKVQTPQQTKVWNVTKWVFYQPIVYQSDRWSCPFVFTDIEICPFLTRWGPRARAIHSARTKSEENSAKSA